MSSSKKTVFVFCSYGIGQSDDGDLKIVLARKFLALIAQGDALPSQLCFYTDGVRLCIADSPVLAELQALEAKGVELLLCFTCLERFGLVDRVAVGIVGGMGDIITAITEADNTVTL
jgi:sulfur relay (sulfurtransferase) complex TusBCD TusD component (DsrE family)